MPVESLFTLGLVLLWSARVLSSLTKNEEAANSIALIISVPLQFFMGALFPLDIMPRDAQIFGEALPFTKLVDAMKEIITRNLGVDAIIPELVYLTVSGIILFTIGTIAYRIALKRL
jgi:ABC-type multidrug transport system permease subunit